MEGQHFNGDIPETTFSEAYHRRRRFVQEVRVRVRVRGQHFNDDIPETTFSEAYHRRRRFLQEVSRRSFCYYMLPVYSGGSHIFGGLP